MIKPEDQNIYAPYLEMVGIAIDEFATKNKRKPVLLDIGCGHSTVLEDHYKKCEKVIGVDLDIEGLEKNELVDEKYFTAAELVPLKSGSVDIIVSAWVLEHIEFPEKLVDKCNDLLTKNGKFIFITPNKWSPYAVVTRAVPNKLHGAIVKFFYKRDESDTFHTFFKMNTKSALDRLFTKDGNFALKMLKYNDDELYAGFWQITKPVAKLWQKVVMTKPFAKIRAHIIGMYEKTK